VPYVWESEADMKEFRESDWVTPSPARIKSKGLRRFEPETSSWFSAPEGYRDQRRTELRASGEAVANGVVEVSENKIR
jgi:hypothetical protein